MHARVWTISIYLFVAAILALTAIAILAIWGILPKETVWKAFSSAGVLALLLIALSAALRAAGHSEDAIPPKEEKEKAPSKETTLKF